MVSIHAQQMRPSAGMEQLQVHNPQLPKGFTALSSAHKALLLDGGEWLGIFKTAIQEFHTAWESFSSRLYPMPDMVSKSRTACEHHVMGSIGLQQ